MDLEIREATLDDLKDIIDFNQQLFDYEYKNFDKTLDCKWPSGNEEYYKGRIEKKDSLALIVSVDGKLVGYLIGAIIKPKDYRTIKKLQKLRICSSLKIIGEKELVFLYIRNFLNGQRRKELKEQK